MNRKTTLIALTIFAGAIVAYAFPKPSLDRISWELDVKVGAPDRVTVKVPGQEAPQAYWYMPFTITNNSGVEQDFLPEIVLVDDQGRVHRSDQNIPKEVFGAVRRREAKPLMDPLSKVTGRILVGGDQARDTVAIFPEPLERMGDFSIFITGLSGEAVWYKDGKTIELKKADWTKIKPEDAGAVLRKTLQLDYQVPGDEVYKGRDQILKKGETWVMR